MEQTILVAYDKKTGEYVDSITTTNQEAINYFYIDFAMCNISRED